MAQARLNGSDPGRSVLAEAVRRTRGAFGTVAVFSCAMNLLILAGPLYMLQVYDRVLSSGKVETLILLTVIVAAAMMAWAALEALRTAVTVRIGLWLTRTLGPFYIDSGLRAKLGGANAGGQAFRDLGQVQSFVATAGMTAFFDMPWTPVFIAVIWVLHPWLGMLALGATVLLLLLSLANDLATRDLLKEANESQIESVKVAEAAIRNADSVASMGMGPSLIGRWIDVNAGTEQNLLGASRRGGMFSGAGKFLRMFSQSAILGLGAYLVIRGEATAGVMIAGSILLGRALAPVDVAMSAWKSFSGARLAYDRLKTQAEAHPPEPKRLSMPRPRGGLEVRDVSMVGPGGPVLRRVSFEAGAGEAVAIIGPSAAGKSTLCKVIVGLSRPNGGGVRLDRVDLNLWNRDELGPHIGYLPQEAGLFAGTIRENIARFRDTSDDDVLEAARLAHAHDVIAALPNGYETVIGEGGAGLSGGQKQRIGLARAVFGGPALIVLDEPNANLDQAGEAALAESIRELKAAGATLLIVGHRPSTLAEADLVLLLREGVVQAFGPRNEVLGKMRAAAQARASEPAELAEPEPETPDEPSSDAAAAVEPEAAPVLKKRLIGPWRSTAGGTE